ncbi:MAG: hypothetical protein HYS13_17495 [Planctomycetia bacterium]|nr:hypothetical protein [Planctomycetia bacterium]
MNYTVVWSSVAERELANLWLNAGDRDVITRAAYAMDKELRADPENAGESRSEGRRIVFAAPVAAVYFVFEDDRRVEVLHVWRY